MKLETTKTANEVEFEYIINIKSKSLILFLKIVLCGKEAVRSSILCLWHFFQFNFFWFKSAQFQTYTQLANFFTQFIKHVNKSCYLPKASKRVCYSKFATQLLKWGQNSAE